MSEAHFGRMILMAGRDYKAGEPRPTGYIANQEWDAVQRKAGLRQTHCPKCGKWRYPQEWDSGSNVCNECRGAAGKSAK